jgi:hypothetical protein
MNYHRAITAAKSMRLRRVAILAAMFVPAMLLMAPHFSIAAARDAIASMHAAWLRVMAPGMQFPAGRLTPRTLRFWIAAVSACYLARLNSRFVQSL